MNKNVIEFFVILVAVYALMAFIIGTFNCLNWGVVGRSAYILISIAIFVINKKYAHV
jgi:hypothetical protein